MSEVVLVPERLAYRLQDAATLAGRSTDSLYRAIARGELHARKDGRTTIILRRDLEAYLEALPELRLRSAQNRG